MPAALRNQHRPLASERVHGAALINRRALLTGTAAAAAAGPAFTSPFRIPGRGHRHAATSPSGPTRFLFGAWLPEPNSTAANTWASRGINVALAGRDDEFGWTPGAWRAAYTAAGIKLIVRHTHANSPTDTLAADNADANVLAIMTYDEPELQFATLSPAILQAEVNADVAAGATKAFGVGFAGNGPSFEYNGYTDWLSVTGISWKWSDYYAAFDGTGDPYWFGDLLASYDYTGNFTTMVGKAVRLLIGDLPYQGAAVPVPGLHIFQFLASGRVQVGKARLTQAQHSLQFWSVVINGGSGVFYFPQYDAGGASFIADDTDAAMEGYIADAVTKIGILENQGGVNVLMDTANGGRRPYTLRKCCTTTGGAAGQHYPTATPNGLFNAPAGNEMQAWFEGCEIAVAGETYRLVVNLAEATKSLTDTAWGLTANSFAAGQVKCFKASAPTVDIFA